jgi:hypothetical protein
MLGAKGRNLLLPNNLKGTHRYDRKTVFYPSHHLQLSHHLNPYHYVLAMNQHQKTQVRFMLTDDAISRLEYVAQVTGCNLSSLVEKAIISSIASNPSAPTPKAVIGKEYKNDRNDTKD